MVLDRKEHEKYLKLWFGLEKFYDRQWEVIEKLLNKQRVLLIEKTSFGKSLCYQYVAQYLYEKKQLMTIVYSPLLALMRDQISSLQRKGIRAGTINSEQTEEQNEEVMKESIQGNISILYIAPERNESENWRANVINLQIGFLVVDEAHCISVWGHDFRPNYQRIVSVIKLLEDTIPVLAVTATATTPVVNDIQGQIGNNIELIRGDLFRPNLSLSIIKVKSQKHKLAIIYEILKNLDGVGIVYTDIRSNTFIYSAWLNHMGISSVAYNAGIANRKEVEQDFFSNKYKVIVSTNALGMGVDKGDIRFVIHTHMTDSILQYYQEIGRAGRDGKESKIYLLYHPFDYNKRLKLIKKSKPSHKQYDYAVSLIRQSPRRNNELLKIINLKQNQMLVLLDDLINQNIIYKNKSYYYARTYSSFDYTNVQNFIDYKVNNVNKYNEMINSDQCRMAYICNYLESNGKLTTCNCCDICMPQNIPNEPSEETLKLLDDYLNEIFIEDKIKGKQKEYNLISATLYGDFTNVGIALQKCKYETHEDFPQICIDRLIIGYKKFFKNFNHDMILSVPPSISGDLVKNLAIKVANALNIPYSPDLIKTRETQTQKFFESKIAKKDNLLNAFALRYSTNVANKKILLIDDIVDSGVTVSFIADFLISSGATQVDILVLARTMVDN